MSGFTANPSFEDKRPRQLIQYICADYSPSSWMEHVQPSPLQNATVAIMVFTILLVHRLPHILFPQRHKLLVPSYTW